MLAEKYLGVALFAIVALLLPTSTFFMTRLLRPRKSAFGTSSFLLGIHWKERTAGDYATESYECGNRPIGEAHIDFHFQYYMYAIIFVVADVMTLFILLWAVRFDQLTEWGKWGMLGFMFVLLTGVTFALQRESKVWI